MTAKYDGIDKNSHFADPDPMVMLDAFAHVSPTIGRDGTLPSGFKEMPYTDEAAIFFYQTMLNIVKLAKAVGDFFGSEQLLLQAIKSGTPLLGGPKGS